MPLGKELETAVMVTVWVCTRGGCGWEHSPMSGGSTRPSAPHSNQLVSHHALPRKACFQQKQTFTRLVSCFLEAWESPSHLLTHHQLDERGEGGRTEHYGGHKWVGKNDSDAEISTKREKKREMQVYQQPIPIVVRIAHHCATPLQQPDVHLCMMGMKTTTLLWELCIFPCCGFEMVLQRHEQVRQPWNHREAKQRQSQHHWEDGVRGYLEAAYDLWTITLEIGSWGRSYYPPRAVRHFGIRRFFLQHIT